MKNIKKYLAFTFLVAACAVSVNGIYASFADNADVKITSVTGAVNVNMTLTQKDYSSWGSYKTFEAPDYVVPGSQIEEILTLNNNGLASYVRIKLELLTENSDLNAVDIYDCYDYDSSKWVKRGEYLYYKEALAEPDGKVVAFNNFTIPGRLSSGIAGASFKTKITAEAIQAENFTPDFDSASPWGTVVPEASAVRTY